MRQKSLGYVSNYWVINLEKSTLFRLINKNLS